jgi:hypothetical protein
MSGVDERGESIDKLSLAAAMAQSYARDQYGFVSMVALMLEESLPSHVAVVRKPVKMFSSEKKVVQVSITFGSDVFDIQDLGKGQGIYASETKVVRGITLKSAEVSIDQWLIDLDRAVSEHAQGNQFASEAIQQFLKQHGL